MLKLNVSLEDTDDGKVKIKIAPPSKNTKASENEKNMAIVLYNKIAEMLRDFK